MHNFIFIFATINLGFFSGQIAKTLATRYIATMRYVALFAALRVVIPITVASAIWNLDIQDWEIIWLPIIGAITLISGFIIGLTLCRLLVLNKSQKGVYGPAAGYTNIGAIGSFVAYIYLGEQGLALVPLFKLFEELIYFTIFFPFAIKHSSTESPSRKASWWQDPVIVITLIAIVIGFTANLLDITRPNAIAQSLNYLIPIGSFCLMYSIGLTFKTKSLLINLKLALLISILKLTILPIITFLAIHSLGLDSYSNGLLLKLCVLLAMMPMAFIVVVPAAIYKLDQDLANTTWLTSTILFIIILPIIPWILSLL